MCCLICKMGRFVPGRTAVTLHRKRCTVVLKDVPADVCDTCGQYYLSEDVAREVQLRAEVAVRNDAELAILRYAV